jgi:hypothetical protein
LVRVCEEFENMMNITMMEDKLDGSNNFKSPKDRTLEEGLLWVIQNGDTMTIDYPLHEDVKRTKINQVPLEKSYQHPQVCTCIYIICIIVMREIAGGRNLLLKSRIQRDLDVFRGTTDSK